MLHKLGTTGRMCVLVSVGMVFIVGCVGCGGGDVDGVDEVGCGAEIGFK